VKQLLGLQFFFKWRAFWGVFTLCSKSVLRRFEETYCLCRDGEDLVQLSAEVTGIKQAVVESRL